MNTHDNTYLELLRHILAKGKVKGDRTGTGTTGVHGYQMRFDLSDGFPLLTTKKIPFRLIVSELLWFIKGDTNLRTLLLSNNHIWDEWPYKWYLKKEGLPIPKPTSAEWTEGMKAFTDRIITDESFASQHGNLGPVYGYQWRNWPNPNGSVIDQLKLAVETLRKNPESRRIIVSAWNPADIDEMAKAGLPPCHCLFQFFVADGTLDLQLYQRSCDTFLGVPFNIASYALLLQLVASVTGLKAGTFIWTGGDVHIYSNHMEQVAEQLSREPKKGPIVKIKDGVKELWDFTPEDIELINYEAHPSIKAEIAI